ncbi:PREDICTED: molybdate-anion transporter-like [Tarenaya hassleriana]|uniref:molybdate-anion transporter-like n=1 Tax=Tarenaya hassleriana TaxID=28532 RepID=UPI00053C7DE1|nr:PREDICTED: molybdate-anion transporter-like [Tarenaya hassleriana]
MGVVIESSVWEPSSSLFVFFFVFTSLSVLLLPFYAKSRTFGSFDHSVSSSFTRFQRWFLFVYAISSVMEGLWSVYGEFELAYYEETKEVMVFYLCVGYAATLIVGPLLGVLSDLIGHQKICLLFCILHFGVGAWKRITRSPSAGSLNVCLSLSALIFSFGFETWMVVEHEKQSQRNNTLNDTFWLMTFLESASLIGSQVLANWLSDNDIRHGLASSATVSLFLSVVVIVSIFRTAKGSLKTLTFRDYTAASCLYVLGDKRIWLLGTSQACLQFAIAVFWILWAPTIVADGREVNLGLIYPCLLGARMLGSTVFPWILSGQSLLRVEDFLVYILSILGIVVSIVAYDYQEIWVLLVLFCLFHGGSGLVLPLLARLRTMYVPNELRGGMMSLSQVPANAAVLFCLIQRGYHRIENSTMMALGAVSLFIASGCIYSLRRWGKPPHQDWHKL